MLKDTLRGRRGRESQGPEHGGGPEAAKRAAAERAAALIEPGMKVGLGSGTTAEIFVEVLAERVRGGLDIVCVASSQRTGALAERLRAPLTTLNAAGWLDVTVDGADEIDPSLRLIKGGGGALLVEKILANASDRMIVIADARKEVETLGAYPLPVEVTPFGWQTTRVIIEHMLGDMDVGGREVTLRLDRDAPFVTDEGNMIFDLALQRIGDPETLSIALNGVPGVVDNGLFLDLADAAIIADDSGEARVLTWDGA